MKAKVLTELTPRIGTVGGTIPRSTFYSCTRVEICNDNVVSYRSLFLHYEQLTTILIRVILITRVGKVSGIEVSGRVSGMPEMPGTKPGFGRPKLPKTINL